MLEERHILALGIYTRSLLAHFRLYLGWTRSGAAAQMRYAAPES